MDTEYRIQFLFEVGTCRKMEKYRINFTIYKFIYSNFSCPKFFAAHEKTVFCILYPKTVWNNVKKSEYQ